MQRDSLLTTQQELIWEKKRIIRNSKTTKESMLRFSHYFYFFCVGDTRINDFLFLQDFRLYTVHTCFLDWTRKWKIPPYELLHFNAQVSLLTPELPCNELSVELWKEKFPAAVRFISFCAKREKKFYKELKCWWCRHLLKGVAPGRQRKRIRRKEKAAQRKSIRMGNFCQKHCPCFVSCAPWLLQERDCEQSEKYKTGQVIHNPALVGNDFQPRSLSQGTWNMPEPDNKYKTKPLPPLPCPKQKNCRFVALFDYQARTEEDLSFCAGDKLEVLDSSQEGWWYARLLLESESTRTGRKLQGYIPANYVAADESIEAEP